MELEKASSYNKCHFCGGTFVSSSFHIRVTRRRGYNAKYVHSDYFHIECFSNAKVRPPKRCCLRSPHSKLNFDECSLIDDDTRSLIYQHVFPGVIPKTQRPFLPYPENMEKMSIRDLKLELKKRDVNRDGKKAHLVRRLSEYLNSEEVRDALAKPLVLGYCRRMERGGYKMNIPVYIKHLVVEYFGFGIPSLYEDGATQKHRARSTIKPRNDVSFKFLKV